VTTMTAFPARHRTPDDRIRATGAPGTDPLARVPDPSLERIVTLAFAPLHKRAFGVAVGTVAALALAALTVADVLLDTGDRFPLELLAVYLRGYQPSLAGALVGAAWAFGIGFVGGWFAAFTRNAVLAVVLIVTRARVHLLQTHDLLDHL